VNSRFWGGFCLLLLAVVVCVALSGCAAPRYVSDAQDKEMAEKCGQEGCAIIPMPLYRQIIEYIKRSNSA
jgi:uncharacterized protein YceK